MSPRRVLVDKQVPLHATSVCISSPLPQKIIVPVRCRPHLTTQKILCFPRCLCVSRFCSWFSCASLRPLRLCGGFSPCPSPGHCPKTAHPISLSPRTYPLQLNALSHGPPSALTGRQDGQVSSYCKAGGITPANPRDHDRSQPVHRWKNQLRRRDTLGFGRGGDLRLSADRTGRKYEGDRRQCSGPDRQLRVIRSICIIGSSAWPGKTAGRSQRNPQATFRSTHRRGLEYRRRCVLHPCVHTRRISRYVLFEDSSVRHDSAEHPADGKKPGNSPPRSLSVFAG